MTTSDWSRRRAAAISFLANISLDGCHSDINFALGTKANRIIPGSYGDCRVIKEINGQSSLESEVKGSKSYNIDKYSETCQAETIIECTSATSYLVGSKPQELGKNTTIAAFRERTNTAGSDHYGDIRYRKKLLNQASLNDEKNHHFSSNESIGSVIGRGKGNDAKSVGVKEVRILKSKQLRNLRLKDERLILSTENKVPLAIFSHFPYNRNYRMCSVMTQSEEFNLRDSSELIIDFSIMPFKFWSSTSFTTFCVA